MSELLQIVTLLAIAYLVRRVNVLVRRLDDVHRKLESPVLGEGKPEAPAPTTPEPGGNSVLAASGPGRPATSSEDAWIGPWASAPAARTIERQVVVPSTVEADPASSAAEPEPAPPPAASPVREDAPTDPVSAPARPDFEQRFGRRWSALLGGGVVAFGLALLVRHSMQQGYFPPSIRLAGAALLALILCAAAEFFRRRGTFAVPADAGVARRMADIPSILLGTGLAGIFAVAYAAYAVYGFLGAATAFAAMAAAALAGLAASLVYGPALAVLGFLAAQGVPFLIVGDGMVAGAAYVALVGVAGYATAYRGGWRGLENPAGLTLLAWAILLRTEPLAALALVSLPSSALALSVTALRLRPRAAWASRNPSGHACLALLLTAGHGLLLATHFTVTPRILGFEPVATALGCAVLLAALAVAATNARARPVAPVAAAALAAVVAILNRLATVGASDLVVVGLTPFAVWLTFAATSAGAFAVAAVALHRTSRRSPMTALVGTASATILLAVGDLILQAAGGLDRRLLAGLALAQGLGLLAIGRPTGDTIPPARDLASVLAASLGVGLVGLALVVSGLGDGPRTTLVLALTAAGAAGLALAWRTPLFASVAGLAAVPVILHAGIEALRTLLDARHGAGTALWPVLENTLLPGLVLLGTAFALRRLGADAVREADRRWLSLVRAGAAAGRTGAPVSLVVAATASGGLLLGALVATVRWAAYGDPYASLSAPSDVGLAATFALSGAVAALRLHRATAVPVLAAVSDTLGKAAMPLLAVAILANPFVTGSRVGTLPVLNLLVLAYLLPAFIAWRLARDVARSPDGGRHGRMRGYAGGMTVAGLLAYATFAVSQVFQGPVLSPDRITEAELWTHTVVWLLLGVATLGYGLRAGTRVVRLTALGIVGAVAGKVVLVDLAHLTGSARALSVIALGLVLLGIGMVYQRMAAAEART